MPLRFALKSLLLAALLNFFIIHAAFALTVTGIRFGTHPDSQRIVIELSDAAEFRAFALASPSRLIVDMPSFDWKAGTIQKPAHQSVKDVRFGELGSGLSRIVIESRDPVIIQAAFMLPRQQGQQDRLVIDFKKTTPEIMAASLSQVHGPLQTKAPQGTAGSPDSVSLPAPIGKMTSPVAPTPKVKPSSRPARDPETLETALPPVARTEAQKPLIIIDPGHGGPDPGARGANGAFEKNIVLAVGMELKKQLEDSGRYRVRMTRDKDIFIPLRDRVRFARKNGGDLFISLHADSIRDDSVTGASVYTLSETASDAQTAKLAERENKSDLIAGIDLGTQEQDVANILIDLATRDTMNQSKFLANTVVASMRSKDISVLQRPHRSAGFAVLKAPDIPSILVEMGYLTNRSEVERLSSPEHRRKIAATLKGSVDSYFTKIAKTRAGH